MLDMQQQQKEVSARCCWARRCTAPIRRAAKSSRRSSKATGPGREPRAKIRGEIGRTRQATGSCTCAPGCGHMHQQQRTSHTLGRHSSRSPHLSEFGEIRERGAPRLASRHRRRWCDATAGPGHDAMLRTQCCAVLSSLSTYVLRSALITVRHDTKKTLQQRASFGSARLQSDKTLSATALVFRV